MGFTLLASFPKSTRIRVPDSLKKLELRNSFPSAFSNTETPSWKMQQGAQGGHIQVVEGEFENAAKQQFLAYLNA